MKQVYEAVEISRQAAYKHHKRQLEREAQTYQFFEEAGKIRKKHPRVGCRKMASGMICKGWGRDKVEQLLLLNGYRVRYRPKYVRTTQSQHEIYYPNRIEGMELDNINQVMQTDTTYFRVGDKFYYLIFIIDVYSRRIVGHAVSRTLKADGNIKALQRMLVTRKGCCLSGLIHHSDKGSQYIDKDYRNLLKKNKIKMSMCDYPWENAFTERINRTIKEEYLDGWVIHSHKDLSRKTAIAVNHYNNKRAHNSLNRTTPIRYEEHVQNTPVHKREKLKIYNSLDCYSQNQC